MTTAVIAFETGDDSAAMDVEGDPTGVRLVVPPFTIRLESYVEDDVEVYRVLDLFG